MVRGTTRRNWVKLYVTGWLHGSIRWQMSPDERSVWADLLALAGECGQSGNIIDNDGRPYPHDYIAHQLNIEPELLARTLEKCARDKRVTVREGVIRITNWLAYQSEYERQRPYRYPESDTLPATPLPEPVRPAKEPKPLPPAKEGTLAWFVTEWETMNGGRRATESEILQITDFYDHYKPEKLKWAFHQAVMQGKVRLSYVEGTLEERGSKQVQGNHQAQAIAPEEPDATALIKENLHKINELFRTPEPLSSLDGAYLRAFILRHGITLARLHQVVYGTFTVNAMAERLAREEAAKIGIKLPVVKNEAIVGPVIG